MAEPLRRILIVGGGTAGWMTAAYLSRVVDLTQCGITLVESADIGTVGVGEATVPSLVKFIRFLQIDEDEFLRSCNATYKLGIRFVDWHRGHDSLWHPFGLIGGTIDGLPVFHHWLRAHSRGLDPSAYGAYSLQQLLGENGKAPRTEDQGSIVTRTGAYAFHVDAKAFAEYLCGYAVGRGVRRIVDNVDAVVPDDQGGIARVDTRQHGSLHADLYIDCTGFAGLLAEKALKDPWIDWNDTLLCDRAVVMPLPEDEVKAPYTLSTASSAGWIWRIPLSHRVGCGYVYASHFIDDDRAADELLAFAAPKQGLLAPRVLRMRIGRRQQFWRGNCVAIGLAAGFVEPLESTGLFLIQRGVEMLWECFPGPDREPALIELYNQRMAEAFDEVRDFIVMHYVLSRREDTPFWNAARHVRQPDSLRRLLERYDAIGRVDDRNHALFAETSYHALAAGFQRLPRRPLPAAEFADMDRTLAVLAEIRKQNEQLARTLPPHEALIASVNRRGAGAQKTP
jgi:tryptophan halogenase